MARNPPQFIMVVYGIYTTAWGRLCQVWNKEWDKELFFKLRMSRKIVFQLGLSKTKVKYGSGLYREQVGEK